MANFQSIGRIDGMWWWTTTLLCGCCRLWRRKNFLYGSFHPRTLHLHSDSSQVRVLFHSHSLSLIAAVLMNDSLIEFLDLWHEIEIKETKKWFNWESFLKARKIYSYQKKSPNWINNGFCWWLLLLSSFIVSFLQSATLSAKVYPMKSSTLGGVFNAIVSEMSRVSVWVSACKDSLS